MQVYMKLIMFVIALMLFTNIVFYDLSLSFFKYTVLYTI